MIRYFCKLTKGKMVLWCYLIWYLVTVFFYFDPAPPHLAEFHWDKCNHWLCLDAERFKARRGKGRPLANISLIFDAILCVQFFVIDKGEWLYLHHSA